MESFTARDGKKICVRFWEDGVSSPRGAVVVVHGMCEYIDRYDDFCRFLNSNGFYVIGMDNRGFGHTDEDALGLAYDGMFEDTVDDIKQEVDIAKERWNVNKVLVVGHSYGSFLAQRFIERYSGSVSGAVLVGSALQGGIAAAFGRLVAKKKCKSNPKAVGRLFADLTFTKYDKKFGEGYSHWLNRDNTEVAKYVADKFCNFTCSVGFYKTMLYGIKSAIKDRSNVPSDFRLMLASGKSDGVGEYGKDVKRLHRHYLKKCGIDARLKLYDGARHEILNEINKGEVYEDIVDFLIDCLEPRASAENRENGDV